MRQRHRPLTFPRIHEASPHWCHTIEPVIKQKPRNFSMRYGHGGAIRITSRPNRSPDDLPAQHLNSHWKWPCNWNVRNTVRPLLTCLWVRGVISWFRNLRERVFTQAQSYNPHAKTRLQKIVKLQITVPQDIESEWTFPSPLTAQKQRIFAGAHPFDTSILVLPYINKMGLDLSAPWKSIRTPSTLRNLPN